MLRLPEEYQRLVQNRQNNRNATIQLPTQRCALLQASGDFMSYEQYRRLSTQANQPATRPYGAPFNPLDPNVLRQAAMAASHPPLTKPIFQKLVARCRGQKFFGT